MRLLELILNKLLSARFLCVMGLTATACIMAFKGRFPTEVFASLVTLAIRDYFQRTDREAPKDTKNGQNP